MTSCGQSCGMDGWKPLSFPPPALVFQGHHPPWCPPAQLMGEPPSEAGYVQSQKPGGGDTPSLSQAGGERFGVQTGGWGVGG